MKLKHIILTFVLILNMVAPVIGVNTTAERTYFAEDTAIPFEVFELLVGMGIVFLVLGAISGYGLSGGVTMIFGILSFGFLAAAAFAAPTTGFYSYITTTNATAESQATPVVWLILQPWMMWLLWGLATIAFIVFVWGLLKLFTEFGESRREHDRDENAWYIQDL